MLRNYWLPIKSLIVASSWSHLYLLIKDARSFEYNGISCYCSAVYMTKREILRRLMNTGTGAAAATTTVPGIVQNQRINHLETCTEKKENLSTSEFRNVWRILIYRVAKREKISSRVQQYSKDPSSLFHSTYLQNLMAKGFSKGKSQRKKKYRESSNGPITKKNCLEVIAEKWNYNVNTFAASYLNTQGA